MSGNASVVSLAVALAGRKVVYLVHWRVSSMDMTKVAQMAVQTGNLKADTKAAPLAAD